MSDCEGWWEASRSRWAKRRKTKWNISRGGATLDRRPSWIAVAESSWSFKYSVDSAAILGDGPRVRTIFLYPGEEGTQEVDQGEYCWRRTLKRREFVDIIVNIIVNIFCFSADNEMNKVWVLDSLRYDIRQRLYWKNGL